MAIKIAFDSFNIAKLDYIPMNKNPRYRIITRLEVPKKYRRLGNAHNMLKQICEIADKEDFILFIYLVNSVDFRRIDQIRMLKKHKFDHINTNTMYHSSKVVSIEELKYILEKYEMED